MPTRKTTAKPKNQMGLLAGMDKDIESAKHDDIMLWLDQHLNEILPTTLPLFFGTQWVTHQSAYMQEDWFNASDYVVFTIPSVVPWNVKLPHVPARIEEKVWEHPIRDRKSGGLVGFCDLYVRATYFAVSGNMSADKENYGAEKHELSVYFEVKTTIQLGQLIRQINLYKMHTESEYSYTPYVVVSPDTRYVDTLKEQGILFVEYPGK